MSLSVGLWIFLVLIALVLLFAIIGNALVIYCVIKIPKLRSVTNVLICNLALSDILLSGFVMPQKLHDLSHEEDFFEGDILCKMVNFSPVFVITSSIYTLVVVSFERRRAILDSNRANVTYSSLNKIIPLIWLFGLLVSIPTLFEYSVNTVTVALKVNETKSILSCGSQHIPPVYSLINALFVALISYVVPVALMFKNYFDLATYLSKKIKQMANSRQRTRNSSFNVERYKSKDNVVKLLVIVAVIFAVSWLPFFTMLLYAKITRNDASSDATGFANLFLIALASFSTAYNVILYVIYNPSFSSAIKNTIVCRPARVIPLEQIEENIGEAEQAGTVSQEVKTNSTKF